MPSNNLRIIIGFALICITFSSIVPVYSLVTLNILSYGVIVHNKVGIRRVGTYGSYLYHTPYYPESWGSIPFDPFLTYGPTDVPKNRFHFSIIQTSSGFAGEDYVADSSWDAMLQQIKNQGREIIFRTHIPMTSDLETAKQLIQQQIGDMNTDLVDIFLLNDENNWMNPIIPALFNPLYDWMKATYNKPVYQMYAHYKPQDGYADGRQCWNGYYQDPNDPASWVDMEWKADGWVFYQYWGSYDRMKGYYKEFLEKQGKKRFILVSWFSPNEGGGFDPWYHTIGDYTQFGGVNDGGQIQAARDLNLDLALFASNNADNLYGWWTSDPIGKERYSVGEALIDEATG